MKQSHTWLFAIIVAAAAMARVIDHPWNFAPVGALALFVGAYCRNRFLAIAAPLVVMAVSDIAIGLFRHDTAFYTFHTLTPAVYFCYLLYVILGWGIRSSWTSNSRKLDEQSSNQTTAYTTPMQSILRRALPVGAATLVGLAVFFLVTNFFVWRMFETYPKTLSGLVLCYEAGIPFIRNQLAGDAFYVVALFGGYELLKQRMPATEEAGLLYR